MGWLSGWAKRVILTPDATAWTESLLDFSLPVRIGSASGATAADLTDIFDELGDNYKKIAATKSDGETQLKIEVEHWSAAGLLAVLHIRGSAYYGDTTFYLYYDSAHSDNTAYVAKTQDMASAGFTNGPYGAYGMANHFAQEPSSDDYCFTDSTLNSIVTGGGTRYPDLQPDPYETSCEDAALLIDGQLGSPSAYSSGASCYVRQINYSTNISLLDNLAQPYIRALIRINAWPTTTDYYANIPGNVARLVDKGGIYTLYVEDNGRIWLKRYVNSTGGDPNYYYFIYRSVDSGVVSLDTWHTISFTTLQYPSSSGDKFFLYVDGVGVDVESWADASGTPTTWAADSVAAIFATQDIDVDIDELRIVGASYVIFGSTVYPDNIEEYAYAEWLALNDGLLSYELDTTSITDGAGAIDSIDALVNDEVREHTTGAGDSAAVQAEYASGETDTAGADDTVMGGFEFGESAETDTAGAGDSTEFNFQVERDSTTTAGAYDDVEAYSYGELMAMLSSTIVSYEVVLTGAANGEDDIALPANMVMINYKQN